MASHAAHQSDRLRCRSPAPASSAAANLASIGHHSSASTEGKLEQLAFGLHFDRAQRLASLQAPPTCVSPNTCVVPAKRAAFYRGGQALSPACCGLGGI